MIYKMIDLCAGIGGIRRGFELAKGFENVLAAEIDKYACMTYEHLYGDNPMNDITDEEFKKKVEKIDYDILLAGFPCQTFSRAGKQEGFHDKTRGTLFFDIADIIKRTRPKAFLLENVDSLITHNKGETFDTIIRTLTVELNYKVIGVTGKGKDIEYNARTFVRNSRYFGVPQNRPRVYIIGFNRAFWGDEVDNLPNTLPEKSEKKIYNNLNDVLDMNAEPEFFLARGYLETLERHKARHESKGNGFGYKIVNLPETENPVSNALLATGGSGKERNLVIDKRKGIAGKQLPNKKTPLNDKGIRFMTPREWGKLQGFVNYAFIDKNGKDMFSFPNGVEKAQQYKQFGNAVTIPAVEEMAKFMKKCLTVLEDKTMAKSKEIRASSDILNSRNKTCTTFKKYISADFEAVAAATPHEYVKTCWNSYKSNCPKAEQTQSLNGKIFEAIIETCLYRERILPMFLQAQITFVTNVSFDIVLFKEEQRSPIGISVKTSFRERYKQADLEAVALKYVHRNSENYLISLQSSEVDSVKQKFKQGDLLGINRVIAADTPEFDDVINYLKSFKFTDPGSVPIITGSLVKE